MRYYPSVGARLTAPLLATLLLAAPAFGQIQETRHDRVYIDRERAASPAIRNLLLAQRTRANAQHLRFTVGYTFALDHKLEEITGGQRIADASVVEKQNARVAPYVLEDKKRMDAALLRTPALKARIPLFHPSMPTPASRLADFRQLGVVSPVREQKGGTCWVYAAVAALEASSRLVDGQPINGSEHFVITNDTAGYGTPGKWNDGGYCYKAVDFLTGPFLQPPTLPFLHPTERKSGTISAAADPDDGTQGTPRPNLKREYGTDFWGFCHGTGGQATVDEIKRAMVAHGPVATWIDAGGTFGSYTSGVYDDTDTSHKVGGHFVLIVGWDDAKKAWLIKNSWGTNWGDTCGFGTERGYAWVGYGIHGIGTDAVWVHAHPKWY